jgi:hypothetical protein
VTRLARLLDPVPSADLPDRTLAATELDRLGADGRAGLTSFLDRVALHNWQRVTAAIDPTTRMALLLDVVAAWATTDADHVVLAGDAAGWNGCLARSVPSDAASVEATLSGVRLVTIDL